MRLRDRAEAWLWFVGVIVFIASSFASEGNFIHQSSKTTRFALAGNYAELHPMGMPEGVVVEKITESDKVQFLVLELAEHRFRYCKGMDIVGSLTEQWGFDYLSFPLENNAEFNSCLGIFVIRANKEGFCGPQQFHDDESMRFEGWSVASVVKSKWDNKWAIHVSPYLSFKSSFDPSPFGYFKLFNGGCRLQGSSISRLFSSIGSLLGSAPYQDSEKSVDEENNNSGNFNPKFYCLASLLFFLFGLFLAGWGWWNADHGDRPVWEVLALLGIGGGVMGTSILVFGVSCC